MNYDELTKRAPKGPIVFGDSSDTECMGIDLPDGRALLLDGCGRRDAAFLRLVVHRYNHFDEALTRLERLVESADALATTANLSQCDGEILAARDFLARIKEVK